MKNKIILITKKTPALREDALKIKKEAGQAASGITIDFSRVYFMSRAFADELLNVMEQLKTEEKKIHLKKMSPNVTKMLRLVKKQRNNIIRELREA